MPIEITIDSEKQLTTHTVIGEISYEEIMTAVKQLWEGQKTKHVLWDARNGTVANVSYNELASIADFVKLQSKQQQFGGKTALIAPQDIDYAMSRTYGTFAELKQFLHEVKVFRSYEEAMEWFETEKE